ncbi:hypothetical protein [Haloactinomyces albus]|uniref:Cell shape-determining protein MreD n=1 Tax=Haloactinomyces albus TaxID=1352928 RepID=A0AAE4CLH0_9ACTN|nr:hypothetical protein [Haloactinomyces albus]MDR7301824.1 cell shape-determining protein MreD [Haloactinomyces albus]MDR7304729.1 cell shape-determining protein MreD [Haloactinomyces albus]
MAKQSIPGIQTNGGGALKKFVGALVALAVLAMVVQYPNESAVWVKGILGGLSDLVSALVVFLKALTA